MKIRNICSIQGTAMEKRVFGNHIITTNADNAFWVAGYDKEKVYHIQGEYGLFQCSQHGHPKAYRDGA